MKFFKHTTEDYTRAVKYLKEKGLFSKYEAELDGFSLVQYANNVLREDRK